MALPTSNLTNVPVQPARPSPWLRLASVLIALHLLAVFVAPWSATPSPISGMLGLWLRPYLDAAFLNHGYRFFAPDPGPTHLVRYELELADGTTKGGVFPNLKEQRPRLLYHRHMMLSERLDGPPEADWTQAYARSYAQHLLQEHAAKSVTLYLVTHALPYPDQVTKGLKLDDPALYRERKLLTLAGRRAVNLLTDYLSELTAATRRGWHAFWFTPSDTATLGLIRILAGAMLFYSHLVWSLDLEAFFGPHAWLSAEAVGAFNRDGFTWSYFWLIESPTLLWTVHIAALVVFALLTLGLFSRVVSVLAWLIAVSYVNRVPGALFGLDQINVMLAMYLMIGPCAASYSLDRLLAARRAGKGVAELPPAPPSVAGNVAIRLIQCHMCVIYLFAGLSKLAGESWWDGSALWLSFANLEYQSLDMTWLSDWPRLVSLMTHISIAWEISYIALVWPRLTRPIVVALAIPLHLGIAFCLGMITFGLIMLVGNLAFVSPTLVRALLDGGGRRVAAAESQSAAEPKTGAQRRNRPASAASTAKRS